MGRVTTVMAKASRVTEVVGEPRARVVAVAGKREAV
jgi:hypothetical protein